MIKSKNNYHRTTHLLCLIVFLLFAAPAFAQVNSGWPVEEEKEFEPVNPDVPPAGGDPQAPIGEYLWILVLLGLGIGVFKMQPQKLK